ncbi:formate dehydrogenase subunit gamma [Thalassotalea sp. ND16A]|uniref:formate dehydrogenase subunit gamma n=1 Tax=Thalassotalea sp. ND16A TaxID=1535422 RepID=UPI00051A2B2C|nr:formate dehydrogenase subunit gamma [Thalassotalea sp. ND16A]KGJ95984.1 hypothetical protein ND16A_1163 [Thalassotalea sp. ND16A]
MTEFNQQAKQHVADIIEQKRQLPGALLPVLHDIQNTLGFIPPQAIALIASALNQTEAEIHGVISFYHHFKTRPVGAHVIEVCRAEACQAMGSRELEQHVKNTLNLDYHQNTKDQQFSLEPVYCLGNCACAPSIRVADKVYGRMNAEKFAQLLDKLTTYVVELN